MTQRRSIKRTAQPADQLPSINSDLAQGTSIKQTAQPAVKLPRVNSEENEILSKIRANDPDFVELAFSSAMSTQYLTLLAEALERNSCIKTLNCYRYWGWGYIDGIEILTPILEKITSLQTLNLEDNGLGDEEIKILAPFLEQNNLQVLNLWCNRIGVEGVKVLCRYLEKNTGLRTLRLGANIIRDEGARVIASVLEKNIGLHTLALGYNIIGNEGAKAIADALLQNTNLQELALEESQIGNSGVRAFASLILRNNTLKTLKFNEAEFIDFDGWRYLVYANLLANQIELGGPSREQMLDLTARFNNAWELARKQTFCHVMIPMFKLLQTSKRREAKWRSLSSKELLEIFSHDLTKPLSDMLGKTAENAHQAQTCDILKELCEMQKTSVARLKARQEKDLHAMQPVLTTRHKPV